MKETSKNITNYMQRYSHKIMSLMGLIVFFTIIDIILSFTIAYSILIFSIIYHILFGTITIFSMYTLHRVCFKNMTNITNILLTASLSDPLTQLKNRLWLDEFVAHNQEHRISLIIFDLDHFKAVNDELGHHGGDRVLVNVARIVKNTVRSGDDCIRLGGEEFMLCLPNVPPDKAYSISENLRIKFEEQLKVTASFGVTEYTPGLETFDNAHIRADAAMYESKQSGRNAVTMRCLHEDRS